VQLGVRDGHSRLEVGWRCLFAVDVKRSSGNELKEAQGTVGHRQYGVIARDVDDQALSTVKIATATFGLTVVVVVSWADATSGRAKRHPAMTAAAIDRVDLLGMIIRLSSVGRIEVAELRKP
jgi:hypothetical protein